MGKYFQIQITKIFFYAFFSEVLRVLCLLKMWIYELILYLEQGMIQSFVFWTYGYAPFLVPFFGKLHGQTS